MTLAEKTCQPCRGQTAPLTARECQPLLAELDRWQMEDGCRLRKAVSLKDFKEALALLNRISDLAEEQGHHPDMLLSWGKLTIDLSTHSVGGLTEADFILAAKIDALLCLSDIAP